MVHLAANARVYDLVIDSSRARDTIKKFEEVKNNTFNVSSGRSFTILKVADCIIKLLGTENGVDFEKNRIGEVIKCRMDITKARKKLGYKPKINL